MDDEVFSNMLNTLVIATIVIFVMSLGLYGYSSLKAKFTARR